MDYTIFAKDLLRRKMMLENAYNAVKEEIVALENEKTAFTTVTGSTPITGSGENKYEQKILSLISRIDDAKFRKMVITRELNLIRRGYNSLDEYERMILEGFFVHSQKSAADSLMSKFFKERSTIYDDRSKELDKFTRSVYGVVKL